MVVVCGGGGGGGELDLCTHLKTQSCFSCISKEKTREDTVFREGHKEIKNESEKKKKMKVDFFSLPYSLETKE